jgi:hypothetical protein
MQFIAAVNQSTAVSTTSTAWPRVGKTARGPIAEDAVHEDVMGKKEAGQHGEGASEAAGASSSDAGRHHVVHALLLAALQRRLALAHLLSILRAQLRLRPGHVDQLREQCHQPLHLLPHQPPLPPGLPSHLCASTVSPTS